MTKKNGTIPQIAEATGLSLATVSRALAGLPNVLPGTREKVLEAARQLNYVRDRAAVRLKTGKTQVIAFLMDPFDSTQPGFINLLLGLSESVRGTDYHVIVLPGTADEDRLAAVRYVVERGMADGIVMSHTTPQDERVAYLQEQGFPFVTHGRTHIAQPHGYVDFSNEQFAAMGVRALTARGRTRLAILLPQSGSVFCSHLAEGFIAACAQDRVQGECIDQISLDDDPEAIYEWAQNHAARFDGLVVSREAPVLPLLSAIGDCGLQIGPDMDLVIKYSSSLPHYIRQPLLACFEDLHLAGKTLGQSLLAHFARPGSTTAQVLFLPPNLEVFHAPTITTKSK